jgi:hypothetical protein
VTWWREANTTERIVYLFAIVLAELLVVDVLAIILLTAFAPDINLEPLVVASSEILAMMLGAVIGFIGGRRTVAGE